MKIGDIIYLSDDKDKKYLVISALEDENKVYSLITEFDAKFNIKERKITNADINLDKVIAIFADKKNRKIEFLEDRDIITKLYSLIIK